MPLCCNHIYGYKSIKSNAEQDGLLHKEGENTYKLDNKDTKFKYCPDCGKKLIK